MSQLFWLMNGVGDSFKHWSTSGGLGLLVFALISIMCWYLWRKACRLRGTTSPDKQVARSIFLFSCSAGLFASFAAHILLDYWRVLAQLIAKL